MKVPFLTEYTRSSKGIIQNLGSVLRQKGYIRTNQSYLRNCWTYLKHQECWIISCVAFTITIIDIFITTRSVRGKSELQSLSIITFFCLFLLFANHTEKCLCVFTSTINEAYVLSVCLSVCKISKKKKKKKLPTDWDYFLRGVWVIGL